MPSSTDSPISMSTYNFTNSTNSQQDAAAPSARLRPPHLQCVSMDQLSRLYMLGIALCALFLIGCLFNLLMCCLGRRRTAAETGGGAVLQMPFRTKRGRRHHSSEYIEMVSVGGHSSHTTLTSSLYGGVANEVKNGNASKAQQQQQEFRIETFPSAPHSKQSLNVLSLQNNGPSSMAVQQQHVNQQLTSSSTSGGGGGGGAVGPMFHDSAAHQQQQQQQYPPLLHNAKMCSTFHLPMGGGEQHKQQQMFSPIRASLRPSVLRPLWTGEGLRVLSRLLAMAQPQQQRRDEHAQLP
ncbi:hypothetical protein niasHT_034426 [Heterodera trifolii]|uniref:Uncharacterized protein n=1 Tax=Heterodera trifolii TaxID=157864 RepID=A0ABD2HS44_9BILA